MAAPHFRVGLMQKRSVLTTAFLTHKGHTVGEMLSGMQKAVRRSDFDLATYCLCELLYFEQVTLLAADGASLTSGLRDFNGAAVHNLLRNCLRIALAEDVLAFAQPTRTLQILRLIRRWDAPDESGTYDSRAVLEAVQLLCDSDKLRIGADARAFFTQASAPADSQPVTHTLDFQRLCPPNRPYAAERATIGEDNFFLLASVDALLRSPEPAPLVWYPLLEFWRRSQAKGDGKLNAKTGKCAQEVIKCKKRHLGKMGMDMLLWEVLLERNPIFVQAMLEQYQVIGGEDAWFFLAQAVLSVLHPQHPERVEKPSQPSYMDWIRHRRDVHQAVTPTRELPEWVLDMTTVAGKKAKRGQEHFALEGALCLPTEDAEFFQPAWRAAYLDARVGPVFKAQAAAAGHTLVQHAVVQEIFGEGEEEEAAPPAKRARPNPLSFPASFTIASRPGVTVTTQHAHLVSLQPFSTYLIQVKVKSPGHPAPLFLPRVVRPARGDAINAPEVDRLKHVLGLPSAHATIWKSDGMANPWMVSHYLGAPNLVFPLDKAVATTGLVPLKDVDLDTAGPYFWNWVWVSLLWRSVLQCGNTSLTSLAWSPHLEKVVSLDEAAAPMGTTQREAWRAPGLGVQRWWATVPQEGAFLETLQKQWDSESVRRKLRQWARLLKGEEEGQMARKLGERVAVMQQVLFGQE
jgi:hypothetical protein